MEDLGFEVSLIPERKLFYSNDSSFGIYAVNIEEAENWDAIKPNSYGNVTIKGSMPELMIGKRYIATVTPKKDAKYGLGYEVSSIYVPPVSTKEEQRTFLASILTEFQIKSIFDAYPDENVVDLIKKDKFDVNLTKGIGEATFEKIKASIAENEKYQRAIIVLTGEFGIPYNAVKRLSDYYGSPDLLVEKIKENPYILTEVDGFGFKRVDEMALKLGVEKTSPHRIKSCIEFILTEEADNGHCWVKYTRTVNECIKLLNVKISDVEEVLNRPVSTRDGDFVTDGKIVYLRQYHKYESGITEHLLRILNSKTEYSITQVDIAIKMVEEKQGFPFTHEQLEAIHLAVSDNVIIINGKAGTGKTSVIKGVVEVIKTVEGLEYATCALSGKASQRIQESTGLDSFTIHRLLKYNPKFGWTFDEFNQLPHDIIILDEASMVNAQLFYYLLRAIKSGAKVIITGDTAQLEPIGVGNVLVDLIASGKIPKVELTIVHRQAQRSGILSCANTVREGKKFLSNTDFGQKRLGELQDLYMYAYEDANKVLNTVLKIAKQYKGDLLDFQIIVPMKSRGNLSTQNINTECQKIFNRDPIDVDAKNKLERKNVTFLEDDKVIINGNNYDKNIFNGTIGIIKYIDSTFVVDGEVVGEYVVDFEGVGDVRFTKSEMAKIDLAYAITCHKSQGSQWKYVVFALDYSSYVLLNRQLTYTAMTRASEALFMPVELKALQHSIETNNSVKRNTFLPDMLLSA